MAHIAWQNSIRKINNMDRKESFRQEIKKQEGN